MTFRLILQPTMAMLFAARAGMRDAKSGETPYLWAALVGARGRRELALEAWKDVGRVFILGLVMDAIYQFIELKWFYPIQALIVATLLAVVPYILIRGPVTRLIRRVAPHRG
jgi:hypothetical protein